MKQVIEGGERKQCLGNKMSDQIKIRLSETGSHWIIFSKHRGLKVN